MISRQKQIQNLRKYIAEEIANVGLKVTFINALKRNKQSVTNNLVNSVLKINYQKSGKYLRVSSGFNKESNLLTNIKIDIKLPWGLYGAKLDTVEGRSDNAESKMRVSSNSIYKWMNDKRIFTSGQYFKRDKRRGKVYSFSMKESYRKSIAFLIARKINREQELVTRNPYGTELAIKLEFAVFKAMERFRDEYLVDFMNDFVVTFTKAE